MMKKMLLFLLLAGCTAAATAQVRFEKLTMTEACAKARRTGRLLFVDLYASWCPPCRMMDKQVFPRHDVGALLAEHCVCVKFDIDRPEGRELARHYGVAAVPTYLICTADGEPLGRIAGAVDAPQFMKDVRTLLGRHRKASGGADAPPAGSSAGASDASDAAPGGGAAVSQRQGLSGAAAQTRGV